MENTEVREEPRVLPENQYVITFVANGFVSEGNPSEESEEE